MGLIQHMSLGVAMTSVGRYRRKHYKRKAWGSRRCLIRQKFAKGDYDISPDLLKAKDTWSCYYHGDSSRQRWKLKNKVKSMRRNIHWVYSLLCGMKRTEKIERLYGIFFPRCSRCGNVVAFRSVLIDKEWVCWACERERRREHEEEYSYEEVFARYIE